MLLSFCSIAVIHSPAIYLDSEISEKVMSSGMSGTMIDRRAESSLSSGSPLDCRAEDCRAEEVLVVHDKT